MTILLHRACYRIINQSSIPTLLKYVQKGQGSTNANTQAFSENSLTLLTAVSKHSPALYQSHMSELTKALADEKTSTLVEVSIQALANVIRWDPKLAMIDKFVPFPQISILFDRVVNLSF
jgi:sister chromatid cohesion protein PDS5